MARRESPEEHAVMSSADKPPRQAAPGVDEVARRLGVYPAQAFEFVSGGVERAARQVHGPMTPHQYVVAQYMAGESIDLDELFARARRGELDSTVAAAVEQAGSYEALNRNVSGADLCWALRDHALERWGMLATTVLRNWRITTTDDFGRIIFALVDHSLMQKEPRDRVEDFSDVYDFGEALERGFNISDSSDGD